MQWVQVVFLWQKGRYRTASRGPTAQASIVPKKDFKKGGRSNKTFSLSGSLYKTLCYCKEAFLLNLMMIGAQGQMISKVSAKQTRDNMWDKPGRVSTQQYFVFEKWLTAVLCADKMNRITTNMHTPPNEISCSGRLLVSKTSHTTSRTTTAKMKTLKNTVKRHLHLSTHSVMCSHRKQGQPLTILAISSWI